MAKNKDGVEGTVTASVVNAPASTSEPAVEAAPERLEPMMAIAHGLVKVSQGDSMVALRELVAQVFPSNRQKGEVFVQQLARLSSAAEAVVTLGKEQLFKL